MLGVNDILDKETKLKTTDNINTFLKTRPLSKVFVVGNKNFIYDSKANFLCEVDDEDLTIINSLYDKNNQPKKVSVRNNNKKNNIRKLKKRGVFIQNGLDKITLDDQEIVSHIKFQLNNYIPRKFTLEITQECTLRCKYCTYTTNDKNVRKHSSNQMTEDIAYKAIDYYFDVFTVALSKIPIKEKQNLLKIVVPNLSWFGGEPFLNFDLIKKTQKYFESLPWNKHGIKKEHLSFSVVSNLTILNEDIIEFLLNTNIYLFVSLDGGKNENDANRVFIDGRGSFTTVMKNIEYLLREHPEFSKKRILIQSVLADNIYNKNGQKFIWEKFYSNGSCRILDIKTYPQKSIMEYFSKMYLKNFKHDRLDIKPFYAKIKKLNKLNEDEIIKLAIKNPRLLYEFEDLFSLEKALLFDNPIGSNSLSRSFSCPLGIDSIFISTNGDFHMCNKTDHSLPLGNITQGFNEVALKKLYSTYFNGLRNKCNECFAFRFCTICPASLLHDKKFYYPQEMDCIHIRENLEIRNKENS